MTYTIWMLYSVTEAWLRLLHEACGAFDDEMLAPIFGRYADRVKVRLFDSEAFSAAVSDLALFETEEVRSFYFSKELLDTRVYSKPFIEPGATIAGAEGGFRAFGDVQRKGNST